MQLAMDYKKISALFICVLIVMAGNSQNTINSYKIVLLPQKFDFLSSVNEYGLNGTAKTLLEQKGFTVYWTNDMHLPQSLADNHCKALIAEVTQRKALFSTNLTLSLKDCYGNVVFKGKEGRSWEKDFGTAYDAAIRNAFASINYKYDSTLPAPAAATTAAPTPVTTPAAAPATPTPPPAPTPAPAGTPATPTATDASGTLYAQPTPNGYQLIDTSPKKIMTLLKTSLPDCFLANPEPGAVSGPAAGGTPNGVVFKKDGQWFFEYYKDGTLISQKLTIKF